MQKTTESASRHDHLERMSLAEILQKMNAEDRSVPLAVERELPKIERLAAAILEKMRDGGRLFYIGAGTSGRLGVVDASEIPPTFGAPPDWVVGLIAGGDAAIRKAVEGAEDDREQAGRDLAAFFIDEKDFVVGIAASGTTPYVIGGLDFCQKRGISTGCIVCNAASPVAAKADFPVEVVVGPEFVTGSTRLKSGTAQKLVLNMVSTSVMIGLGRVRGNRMVDMQLSNAKLVDRGAKMVATETGLEYEKAKKMLLENGSVRAAVAAFLAEKS